MFRLDKLTQKAQEAVQQCQAIAEKNESQVMFPLHLLIALAGEKEGIVRPEGIELTVLTGLLLFAGLKKFQSKAVS